MIINLFRLYAGMEMEAFFLTLKVQHKSIINIKTKQNE